MKRYNLTLITHNQNSEQKARRFAELICDELRTDIDFNISKYNKFPNSYKIEVKGEITDENNSIEKSIKLTAQICYPWLVEYKELENEVDLIFNQTEFSRYRNVKFNVLKWASFTIESDR